MERRNLKTCYLTLKYMNVSLYFFFVFQKRLLSFSSKDLKMKSGLSRTDARRSAMKDFDRIKHRLNKKKLKTNTESHSKRKVEDSEDENTHDTFQFPIKNDEELELVSKMLSSDESFKNQVYVALNCHEDLKLEHVFSSEFLFDYNLLGINGKKQLENLKEKEGLNNNEIRKLASKELETNKNRIYQRSCRKKQKIVQNQDSIEIEETESSEIQDFSPIKNEEELENVSRKLKSDQEYLKNVRLHIVQSSEDGQCTLEQIFSSNFLTNYILNGLQNKQKLSDTIPYHLKKHMGQNIKEIELDTQIELKQLKQDLIRRKFK
uniref:CSON002866 protein n=1 Tax=Culicoides sonorensis TaxID=179676 RepID=A0A336L1G1_CULSO